MIAAWMLTALVFTALIALAAWCAEAALRAIRRPTRWPWLVALAVAVTWPIVAPLVRRLLPAPEPTTVVVLPSISVTTQIPAASAWMPQLDVVLITLWVVASLIVLARLVRGLMVLAHLRRLSTPQIIDGVPVLISERVGPAVVGVMQPSVMLPASLLALDAPLRRLVLRHEDEHRRARDPLIVLGSAIAVALVPWNLPLWWISRRARLALEVDCDARVLAHDTSATQYGKLLLLISQQQTVTSLAPMLAAYNSQLEQRIDAMMPTRTRRRRTRFAAAVVGTIVVGIAACSSRIGDIAAPRPTAAKSMAPTPVDPDKPYFDFQVEKATRQVPGTGNLRYPDILRKANVEGEVLAQFVVSAEGKYEAGTFKALRSDHELFTQAIVNALPNMTFAPAEIGGKHVRQMVQQPFTFSLSRDASAAPSVPRAPGLIAAGQGTTMPNKPASMVTGIIEDIAIPAGTPPKAPAGTMYEFQVNKTAKQIPGTGNLRYPDMLRSANVEGNVLAQFIVNADGTVDTDSFKVLRSSHELFTQSVKLALPQMRFEPAEVDGKKVRQLMQTPFTFSLSKN